MSDPDWDLSGYCRIRWYKVLRSHPSTRALGMIGAPSAWRAQGPKQVKTALDHSRPQQTTATVSYAASISVSDVNSQLSPSTFRAYASPSRIDATLFAVMTSPVRAQIRRTEHGHSTTPPTVRRPPTIIHGSDPTAVVDAVQQHA